MVGPGVVVPGVVVPGVVVVGDLQDTKKTVSARVSMIAGLYLLKNDEFIKTSF